MANFSKTSLSLLEDEPQDGGSHNNTGTSISSSEEWFFLIIFSLSPFVLIAGLVGNGIVICLLGFRIKRTPFTTYILNLAAADFGVLLFVCMIFISAIIYEDGSLLAGIGFIAVSGMHSASQFILTAVSIDRCVSVLFPIWHRCLRPRHLSTIVCALIWALTCLPSGSAAILHNLTDSGADFLVYLFIAGAVVCLPLVMISTMILLFRVFCKSKQPQRGRILAIVLLTLLFFLIFAFPLNAIFTVNYFNDSKYFDHFSIGFLCACLNSCVNPVIYYMVGRKKRSQERQSLKVILQTAFKEEEEIPEEQDTTAQTSL